MEIVRLVLLTLHILGFAALIGGMFAQFRAPEKRITGPMRDGIGTAFVAGLLLVGVLEASDGPGPDHAKIAVKFVIGLVVLALVMANTRKPRIPDGLFYGIFALSVLNVVVAVFWSPVHGSY